MNRLRATPCVEFAQDLLRQASMLRPIACLTRFVQASSCQESISCANFNTPVPLPLPRLSQPFSSLRQSRPFFVQSPDFPPISKTDPFMDPGRLMEGFTIWHRGWHSSGLRASDFLSVIL